MEKKRFQEAVRGIIQHNKDTVPRVEHPQCNKCKLLVRQERMRVCPAFPNGIPKKIYCNETVCETFEQK